jgi:hypothetical protein
LPKVEPWQVKPDVPPQEPSVEIAVGEAIALDDVLVLLNVSLPQRPNPD